MSTLVSTDRVEGMRTAELSAAERAEMRGLLDAFFEGIDAEQFERDLEEKNWVLRVWRGDRLVGFSTLLAYRAEFRGEVVNVIYSGDTIMAPEAWGSPVLARGWIGLVRRVQATMPPGRCYWLLLSAGFRTYRFLPVFWREFWPRAEGVMDEWIRGLRDALAAGRFGAQFDAGAGVVRFACPQRLRAALAEVPAGRLRDRHVAFFLESNPGWRGGDELVCLTELGDENLTAAGRRIVREAGA